jgi:hypothetical protein
MGKRSLRLTLQVPHLCERRYTSWHHANRVENGTSADTIMSRYSYTSLSSQDFEELSNPVLQKGFPMPGLCWANPSVADWRLP